MRILYATDGSEGALAAARLLGGLQHRRDTHVHILAVLGHDDPADGGVIFDAARAALAHFPGHVTTALTRAHGTPGTGEVAEQVLLAADILGADLIALGTRGRSDIQRFLLGSVSERVVRHAACPVLVARRPLHGTLDTIVAGVDGSPGAERAIRFLAALPLPDRCDVRLVNVVYPVRAEEASGGTLLPILSDEAWELSDTERVEAQARLEGPTSLLVAANDRVTAEVRIGDPASEIVAAAQESNADLVVVGAHGLTGLDLFLIGSVSDRVIRHAPCSVLCVRGTD
jgi:nucleotide-binding universal stress UspA family protein